MSKGKFCKKGGLFLEMGSSQWNGYLDAIDAALEKGMAAKEVVCSITTGFRLISSLRNAESIFHSYE